MKRVHVLILLLVVLSGVWVYREEVKRRFEPAVSAGLLEMRILQYGAEARRRIQPIFKARRVPYPPNRLILLGIKARKVLEIYAPDDRGQLAAIKSYPILGISGKLGPKLAEGDGQVPEGFYNVSALNPVSSFHLSLRLNYPNQFDRDRAVLDRRKSLGRDIMIHGSNVSLGCLAMGDEAIEEIFTLAYDVGKEKIEVILSPIDFRVDSPILTPESKPDWIKELYEELATRVKKLPAVS